MKLTDKLVVTKFHEREGHIWLVIATCPLCGEKCVCVDVRGDISLKDVCSHWYAYSGIYFVFRNKEEPCPTCGITDISPPFAPGDTCTICGYVVEEEIP